MIQTIEQLTTRVRELEEENARLVKLDAKRKKQLSDFDDVIDDLSVAVSCINPVEDLKRAVANLKEQAAASQAYAEQLREALKRIGYDEACFEASENPSEWPVNVALEALSIPNDTSALDVYVAKRLHDMACDKGLLRIQVEELTRQRDLAVDALENHMCNCEWRDIETAPKDGTVFLGYKRGQFRECYKVPRDDCDMWCFGGTSGADDLFPNIKPTHWMPLPKPPAMSQGEHE